MLNLYSLQTVFILILTTTSTFLLGSSSKLNATEIPIEQLTNDKTIIVFAHQDDDLLWMQPLWQKSSRLVLAAVPSSPGYAPLISQHQEILDGLNIDVEYKNNWLPLWGSVTDKEFANYYWRNNPTYTYLARDYLTAFWPTPNLLNLEELKKLKSRLEPLISDPNIERIVTHNPWGEYGHQHHRLVNQAVTDLAVRFEKDVWVLGAKVINSEYIDLAPQDSLDHTYGEFNESLFNQLVSAYRNTFIDSTTTWTGGGFNPTGRHIFLKTVSAGEDLGALNNVLKNTYNEVIGYSVPNPIRDLQIGELNDDNQDDILGIKGSNSTLWYSTNKTTAALIDQQLDIIRFANKSENSANNSRQDIIGVKLSDHSIWHQSVNGEWKTIANNTPVGDLQVGDVNGDGLDDLVILNRINGEIMLSTDWSSWQKIPGVISMVRLADLDGDGDKDLIGVNRANQSLWYTLDQKNWKRIPGEIDQVSVGDFDANGTADIVGINRVNNSVYYTTDLSNWKRVPGNWKNLVVGDFNGDGISDIASINETDRTINVTTDLISWETLSGTGDFVFAGDINGDKKSDLLVINQISPAVWITTDLSKTWSMLQLPQ